MSKTAVKEKVKAKEGRIDLTDKFTGWLDAHTTTIKVTVELTEPMLGTCPADPEVYQRYIEEKKFVHQKKHGDLSPEVLAEREAENVDQKEEKGWTTFLRDQNGIYVLDYWVLGLLKDSGNILADLLKIKNLRSKITRYIKVEPRRIYFGKKVPDLMVERSLRAQTLQGPRVTLVRSDGIETGTQFSFTISILDHKEIDEETIMKILDYGRRVGFGQFRTGGYGRFKVVKAEMQKGAWN